VDLLKIICKHPCLLSPGNWEFFKTEPAKKIGDLTTNELIAESIKMSVLIRLVQQLVSEDHKLLILSQSKDILSIIQQILESLEINLLRLDSNVRMSQDRQSIVYNFNKKQKYKVLLLTSQVG